MKRPVETPECGYRKVMMATKRGQAPVKTERPSSLAAEDVAGGMIVAVYRTSDPVSKVRAFYQATLGRLSKFTEKDVVGRVIFKIRNGSRQKIIVLAAASGGTRIELIRIH